jgi:SAM-dependent methyltransferase
MERGGLAGGEGLDVSIADATTRFSNRADDYARFRPGYPAGVFDLIPGAMGLPAGASVADIGSGTGISARLLLDRGYVVYGVEPNAAMRSAAEAELNGRSGFISANGTADRTTLAGTSVDLITCMQAFHWFDRDAARREFARILRPGGWVMIVWNDRRIDTPFLRTYEDLLLRRGTDYAAVRHKNVSGKELADFFSPGAYETRMFDNAQHFDFAGLRGRLLSSSYAPPADDPRSGPMLHDLKAIFDRHQQGGQVAFLYRTIVHFGQLS